MINLLSRPRDHLDYEIKSCAKNIKHLQIGSVNIYIYINELTFHPRIKIIRWTIDPSKNRIFTKHLQHNIVYNKTIFDELIIIIKSIDAVFVKNSCTTNNITFTSVIRKNTVAKKLF